MKSIELTNKHKNKLLEMCNKLFPEYLVNDYNYWEISANPNYITYVKWNHEAEWGEQLFKIHWFEFCMTHLFDKLFKDPNKLSKDLRYNFILTFESISDYDYHKLLVLDNHPIDYLYGHFKTME